MEEKNKNDSSKTGKKNNKRKRIPKKEKPNRRGRIVIRNLSFKTTEDKLRKYFEEFGKITDLKLLKRPDGKLVGCAFVQYEVVQHAAKAINTRTGKDFLGRPIICDWAIPKDTYLQNIAKNIAEKPIEIKDEDEVEVKEEPSDEVTEIKEETSDNEKSDSDDEDKSDSEKDSNSEESDSEIDDEEPEEPEAKRPRVISNDVNEGKTVFIKNVPFAATNEDLKECMSQFGPIYYALVCIDPVTEHSKGTAFVKFRDVEDAEKCLSAGTELTLMGNVLDCHKAMNKNELNNDKAKAEKSKKDSRNLYLVKEGVVLAGSKAAETVSSTDMAKRLQLERWKTQMLRNLNMFVSKFRIVVHNLPVSWSDDQLRQLMTKYASRPTAVKECRVMRNMRDIDINTGKGKSKEYGFVTFSSHEDALKVLRTINNNPNIFSVNKRPIVSFSIENKSVLNRKNKQIEKSRLNNPNYKNAVNENTDENKTENKKSKKGKNSNTNVEELEFAGEHAKEGHTTLRSKRKLTMQADLHRQKVKDRKKMLKMKKKSFAEKKQQFIRQPQQKQNTSGKKKKQNSTGDTDNFSKLVNQYKNKLVTAADTKTKTKWYQT